MSDLNKQEKQLLAFLVEKVKGVTPGDPQTYVGYKEVHTALGLVQMGGTWGRSLQYQGLHALAEWTARHGLPAITGIVVDRSTHMPGDGFFALFNRANDDDKWSWWKDQVRLAQEYDWSPYLD